MFLLRFVGRKAVENNMKRFLIIVLVVGLLFSLAACGKKVEETDDAVPPVAEQGSEPSETPKPVEATPSENNFVPPSPEENQPGTRLFAAYAEIISKGGYYLKYKENNGDDIVEFATDDGKISVKSGDITQVIEGDSFYSIMHTQKAILTATVGDTMRDNLTVIDVKSQSDVDEKFLEEGEEEVNGQILRYERYKMGENNYDKYYFDKGTLKYIKTFKDGNETFFAEVFEFSKTVPRSLFEIPEGYIRQSL